MFQKLHLPSVRCSVGSTMPTAMFFIAYKPSRTIFILLIMAFVLSSVGCGGPWRDRYFKKGVGRLTQENVREHLGPPHTAKNPALGGDSLWTYRFALSDQDLTAWNAGFIADASHSVTSLMGKGAESTKSTLYCYRYMLTFSEDKVLKNWKREECVPGTRETLTAK